CARRGAYAFAYW
nr:immunoglobulin heavy chain junction region [Mus musculus]